MVSLNKTFKTLSASLQASMYIMALQTFKTYLKSSLFTKFSTLSFTNMLSALTNFSLNINVRVDIFLYWPHGLDRPHFSVNWSGKIHHHHYPFERMPRHLRSPCKDRARPSLNSYHQVVQYVDNLKQSKQLVNTILMSSTNQNHT